MRIQVSIQGPAVSPDGRPAWLFLAPNEACGHPGPRGRQANGHNCSWCQRCMAEFQGAFLQIQTRLAIKQRRLPF